MTIMEGEFRQKVVKYWTGCAITNTKNRWLLKTIHIKPWWKCSSDEERLDTYNGLLLHSDFASLFEYGLISVDQDGSIQKSILLEHLYRSDLGILNGKRIKLEKHHQEYLEFHRDNIFAA